MARHSKTVVVRHSKPSRYDILFPAQLSALYAPTHAKTEIQRIEVSRLTTARPNCRPLSRLQHHAGRQGMWGDGVPDTNHLHPPNRRKFRRD